METQRLELGDSSEEDNNEHRFGLCVTARPWARKAVLLIITLTLFIQTKESSCFRTQLL